MSLPNESVRVADSRESTRPAGDGSEWVCQATRARDCALRLLPRGRMADASGIACADPASGVADGETARLVTQYLTESERLFELARAFVESPPSSKR